MTWESLGWRVYSEGCGGQLSITGPAMSGVFNVLCMERGGRLTVSEGVTVQSRLSMETCDPIIFAGPAIDSMGVALSPGRLPADMLCHPSGPMADRRRFTSEGSISCTPSALPSVSHATGYLVHTLPCTPSRAHSPVHTLPCTPSLAHLPCKTGAGKAGSQKGWRIQKERQVWRIHKGWRIQKGLVWAGGQTLQ